MNKRQPAPPMPRLQVLFLLALAAWGVLIFRTFHIQVVEREYYSDRAENQSTRRILWKPERGRVMDRNYQPLVVNAELPENSEWQPYSNRVALYGDLAAQVVGTVGKDGDGLLGVEYQFDEELRGVDGFTYRRIDASNHYYPGMEVEGRPPVPGMDLVLTLDMEIQTITEQVLRKGVRELEASRGTAIVMDPRTGEVLSMASYPTFDPNHPSEINRSTTRNGMTGIVYEPGSTFKIVTAAAAIEERTMDLHKTIDGSGGRFKTQGGQIIRDTKDHGVMSFADAMAYSSNVAFAKIANTVGSRRFYRFVRGFGFGTQTGLDLPGEERGQLKPVSDWSGRTLVTMAMGHEILTTPMQVVMAFAAVANGGELLRPRVVKGWRHPETGEMVRSTEKQVTRRVISEETASTIRQLLREVVQRGTGRNLKSNWLDIAGKTGTAEKYVDGAYDRSLNLSSFVGMVPASNPRFVCMVLVDEPKKYHSGAMTAGPIFKEIMEKIYLSPKLAPATSRIVYHAPQAGHKVSLWVGRGINEVKAAKTKLPYPIAVKGSGSLIVAQSVMAGASIPKGDTLFVTTANIQAGEMPDLSGMTLRDALSLLDPQGLKVKISGKGVVHEQTPAPGTKIQTGAECELKLGDVS